MNTTEINFEIGSKKAFFKKHIQIGIHAKLTLDDVKFIANDSFALSVNPAANTEMQNSYLFLKSEIDRRLPVYGVNTSFGDQVNIIDQYIKDENSASYYQSIDNRQADIVSSLTCGVGEYTANEIVRVAMVLRAHCLSQGYSGISPTLIQEIINFLSAGIVPIVGRYGSIGASGDLIPLATIAAAMMGADVNVLYQGTEMKAMDALTKANLKKTNYHLRDGLAMINGTSFMTAIASIALLKLNRLFKQMLFAIAMSLESLLVITSPFQPLVHHLKNHTGQQFINDFLLQFWQGSSLIADLEDIRQLKMTNPEESRSLQDYYSLRAVPQGFGTFQENLVKANCWIENEMNSVNDNPIIDAAAGKIYHNANFMGYYVSDACDILKMNIAQASTWIHALLANMVHPRKNRGLPVNLSHDINKNGMRGFQLLAAALAVQNRKLALSHPAFVLPTEGDNQDVNSLGTHAAFDFSESVNHLEQLTTILFLAATQALECRGIKKASEKSQIIYQIIRETVPTLDACRPMTTDIDCVLQMLQHEKI